MELMTETSGNYLLAKELYKILVVESNLSGSILQIKAEKYKSTKEKYPYFCTVLMLLNLASHN